MAIMVKDKVVFGLIELDQYLLYKCNLVMRMNPKS